MINWGIVGAGRIAKVFCNALQFAKSGRLQAIASRSRHRANELADLFGCKQRYAAYDQLFCDDKVDAVYVATIHSAHVQPVLAALAAGKHVLVEKPIATNAADAVRMVAAARESGRFLMEGFMFRCHPQLDRVVDLIATGALGDIRSIRSEFGYAHPYDPGSRVYSKALGGGSILDVGCYPVSMARRIAGAAAGRLFLNPIELRATGIVGPTGVDHRAAAIMKFGNEIIATVSAAVDCEFPHVTVIHGSEGRLTIPDPWLPSSPCRSAHSRLPIDTDFPGSRLLLERINGTSDEICIPVDRDLYSYEADTVPTCLEPGQSPAMSWDDSLGNMETLDRWLAELEISHGANQPDGDGGG